MRLQMILPAVSLHPGSAPIRCPHKRCGGTTLRLHQTVLKKIRDTQYPEVVAQRYECLKCHHFFRVYPSGVSANQNSQRVQGLAILFYLLGLSYGAVALVMDALGVYVCKSRVYDYVQAAAEKVPGLQRANVFGGVQTPAVGSDVTSVKVKGQWLQLGLSVDSLTGLVLSVDELTAADATTLKEWMQPIAEQVGAEILVSDDADAFKTVADELGLAHQVCKSHVVRNTEALIAELHPLVAKDGDGSLAALGVSSAQAAADLVRLGVLIHERQPEQQRELEEICQRYFAAPLKRGETVSLAYRLRLLFQDRWNLWPRLTYYRRWQGKTNAKLDGTNNASERAIGWWIKERYRTMKGYKRKQSAVNVSRLLVWCGNHLGRGGAPLALLMG